MTKGWTVTYSTFQHDHNKPFHSRHSCNVTLRSHFFLLRVYVPSSLNLGEPVIMAVVMRLQRTGYKRQYSFHLGPLGIPSWTQSPCHEEEKRPHWEPHGGVLVSRPS